MTSKKCICVDQRIKELLKYKMIIFTGNKIVCSPGCRSILFGNSLPEDFKKNFKLLTKHNHRHRYNNQVYDYAFNIQKTPICEICKKELTFINFVRGYNTKCNCIRKSRGTK